MTMFYLSDFFMYFELIDKQCARARFALNEVLIPIANISFANTRQATKEIKSGMKVISANAESVGDKIVIFMREKGILIGVLGIVLGMLVFLYSLALAGQCTTLSNLCLSKCKTLSSVFSYFTLYLVLDVYVLVCFFFFFALITVSALESAVVAACYGVDTVLDDSEADNYRVVTEVCVETAMYLAPAVATLVAGGVVNFLLSYHMLAALQAAHFGDKSKAKAREGLAIAEMGLSKEIAKQEKAASKAML
jgi:hypothetical protein